MMLGLSALARWWWIRMGSAAQHARADHRLDVFGVLSVQEVVRGEEHCGEERDGRWSRAEVASVRWHDDDDEEDVGSIVVL
jgi:hypothetical protein